MRAVGSNVAAGGEPVSREDEQLAKQINRRMVLVRNSIDNLCACDGTNIATFLRAVVESLRYVMALKPSAYEVLFDIRVRYAAARLIGRPHNHELHQSWLQNCGMAVLLLMAEDRYGEYVTANGDLEPARLLDLGMALNEVNVSLSGSIFVPVGLHKLAQVLKENAFLVFVPSLTEPVPAEHLEHLHEFLRDILNFAGIEPPVPACLKRALQGLFRILDMRQDILNCFIHDGTIRQLSVASKTCPFEVLRLYVLLVERGQMSVLNELTDPNGPLKHRDELSWRRLLNFRLISLFLAQGASEKPGSNRIWLNTDILRVLWRDHLSLCNPNL